MNAVCIRNAATATYLTPVAWLWSRGEAFLAADGLTFDEPVHLAAGCSYWMTGRFRLNCENPLLLKLLWTAPIRFGDPSNCPHEIATATNAVSHICSLRPR